MRIFLVKKDVKKPNSQDNWIIMTGQEFIKFIKTQEGKKRSKCFALLESCYGINDDIFVECGETKAKEWENERLSRYYRKKVNMKYSTLYFDWYTSEEAETDDEDDVVVDLEGDVETIVMNNLTNEVLYDAISTLTPQQRTLIDQLFLSDTSMTLIEYAKCHGIALTSAYERKERTLFRLKKYFEMYGFDTEIFA